MSDAAKIHGLHGAKSGDVLEALGAAGAHVDAFGSSAMACVLVDDAGEVHVFCAGNALQLLGATAVLEDLLIDTVRGRDE